MKPNKKTIIALIDNSSLSDYIRNNNSEGIDYDTMLRDTDLVDDLDNKFDEIWDEAYESGKLDGFDEGKEQGEKEAEDNFEATELHEVSDLLQEEIGVNYCLEKFKDCNTLEDYKTEISFIYSRSINFMK